MWGVSNKHCLLTFFILNGFTYRVYAYAMIVHTWADQLLPQLLKLCHHNVDTLNICMKNDSYGNLDIYFNMAFVFA